MRYTFKQVLDKIRDFLSGHDEQDYSENDSLISTIEQAIQKKKRLFMSYSLRQVLQVILSNMIPAVSRLLSKISLEM